MNVQAGARAGEIIIDGKVYRQSDWRTDKIYDTISKSAAAIAAGAEDLVFANIANKTKRLTNLTQSGQLPSDWELWVMAIGIEVVPADIYSNLALDNLLGDWYNIFRSSYFEFTVGQTTLVTQGRLQDYPWPFGTYMSVDGSTWTAGDDKLWLTLSNGVPNGHLRYLDYPVYITKDLAFQGLIRWFDAITLAEPWDIRVNLFGQINRPIR